MNARMRDEPCRGRRRVPGHAAQPAGGSAFSPRLPRLRRQAAGLIGRCSSLFSWLPVSAFAPTGTCRDLEAWAYWKDQYISPSLTSSQIADVDIAGTGCGQAMRSRRAAGSGRRRGLVS